MDNHNILSDAGLYSEDGIYLLKEEELEEKINRIFSHRVFFIQDYQGTEEERRKEFFIFLESDLKRKGIELSIDTPYSSFRESFISTIFLLPDNYIKGLDEITLAPSYLDNVGGKYLENAIFVNGRSARELPGEYWGNVFDTILVHEAAHHLDWTRWREFRFDTYLADISKVFYNISWQLDEYSGRKLIREDEQDFIGRYAKADAHEDLALVYESLFVDTNRLQEEVRNQMQNGKFELATKVLFATYIMGFEGGFGSVYGYDPDMRPLTFEEVESNMKEAQSKGIGIPQTTLESFYATKLIFYSFRKKAGFVVPELGIELNLENFPHLYAEVIAFTRDTEDRIRQNKEDRQDAVSALSQLEAKVRVAGVFDTEIISLIKDGSVNVDFRYALIGMISDTDKLRELILDKTICIDLRKEMMRYLLKTTPEKKLRSLIEQLIKNNELELAKSILDNRLSIDTEISCSSNEKEEIQPDLKVTIWDILEKNGDVLEIADFDSFDKWQNKRHARVADFGSYNRYEDDLTQRTQDRYSSDIRYGNKGGTICVTYDVDSPNRAEGGFWMRLLETDARDYKYLRLHLKGDFLFGYPEKVKVEIKNDKGEVGTYYLSGISNDWQEFVIPLSAFEGISDFGSLSEIVLVFNKDELIQREGRIYLDLIGLSREELKDKDEMADRLLSVLDGSDEEAKKGAIDVLGRLGVISQEIKRVLLEALNSSAPEIRAISAEAIGRLKINEAVESLIQLFADQSEDVRLKALEALIAMDAYQDLLEKALEDADWRVRKIAIEAMDEIKATAFKEKLMLVLLSDSSWQVRAEAALSLAKTGDLDLAEVLERVLLDENHWVRLAALFGLRTLGK